jgi:hypothetical protein
MLSLTLARSVLFEVAINIISLHKYLAFMFRKDQKDQCACLFMGMQPWEKCT